MAVRIVPADEFDLAASLVDAGEQQVAEPLFAGRGAVALDDQVEAIGGPTSRPIDRRVASALI